MPLIPKPFQKELYLNPAYFTEELYMYFVFLDVKGDRSLLRLTARPCLQGFRLRL